MFFNSSITPEIKEFCLQEFLPEVRTATKNFNLPLEEFSNLEGNTFSLVIKLIYAFLWQGRPFDFKDYSCVHLKI